MNGRVLVMCASRDRNLSLERMIDSVRRTSKLADVAVYVDEDQAKDYRDCSATVLVGPQVGPVASLNALWKAHPAYEAYGAMTDDCEFVSLGWDEWVLETVKKFPNQIGLIAPWLNGTPKYEGATEAWGTYLRRMDFPWATGKWIDTVGWFAYPGAGHFYWDVVSEVIGWQTGIRYSNSEQLVIAHDSLPTPDVYNKILRDGVRCMQGIAFDVPVIVQRIRKAQRDRSSMSDTRQTEAV